MAHSSSHARTVPERSRSRDDHMWQRPQTQQRGRTYDPNPAAAPAPQLRKVLVIVDLLAVRPLMTKVHSDVMESTTCEVTPSLNWMEERALFTYNVLLNTHRLASFTVYNLLHCISQHIWYTWDHYLPPSHSHSLSLSLSLTLTHSHSLSLPHSHSLPPSLSPSLSLTLPPSLTLTRTLSLTHSHTPHSHHSLTVSLTHLCMHVHTHTHKLTHHHPSITLILPLSLLLFYAQSKSRQVGRTLDGKMRPAIHSLVETNFDLLTFYRTFDLTGSKVKIAACFF